MSKQDLIVKLFNQINYLFGLWLNPERIPQIAFKTDKIYICFGEDELTLEVESRDSGYCVYFCALGAFLSSSMTLLTVENKNFSDKVFQVCKNFVLKYIELGMEYK